MVNGITSSRLGKPDHSLALEQHDAYVGALRSCGLEVHVLDADENYPDSTFVEDTALLTRIVRSSQIRALNRAKVRLLQSGRHYNPFMRISKKSPHRERLKAVTL
jgi:N-dimethylarginine dimethylaminohydrolase